MFKSDFNTITPLSLVDNEPITSFKACNKLKSAHNMNRRDEHKTVFILWSEAWKYSFFFLLSNGTCSCHCHIVNHCFKELKRCLSNFDLKIRIIEWNEIYFLYFDLSEMWPLHCAFTYNKFDMELKHIPFQLTMELVSPRIKDHTQMWKIKTSFFCPVKKRSSFKNLAHY